jgi:hypothetical protein
MSVSFTGKVNNDHHILVRRPCNGSHVSSLVPHSGGPGSSPGYSVWDLWWIKWHWDRYFGFPLSISFHRVSPYSSSGGMNNRPVSSRSSETKTTFLLVNLNGEGLSESLYIIDLDRWKLMFR